MSQSTVVIRVEDGLKTAFITAARRSDRTASQLLRDFMRSYIKQQAEQSDYDSFLSAKIKSGRTALRHKQTKSGAEVEAIFARKRSKSLKKVRQCGKIRRPRDHRVDTKKENLSEDEYISQTNSTRS